MKKLVLLLAVVFSASLFSCNKTEKAAEATDSAVVDTTVVAEVAAVADSTDTTVVAAVEEVVDTVNK